uniref:Uncharacterized protein n=1 Tax=Anguilla anguilla TaxID=7936 RepID=A0A0E9TK84_ANGAN
MNRGPKDSESKVTRKGEGG